MKGVKGSKDLLRKSFLHSNNFFDTTIDFFFRVIRSNGESCRCGDAQKCMQRLRAMMPRTEANAFSSDDFGEIVRMDSVDGEADAAEEIVT